MLFNEVEIGEGEGGSLRMFSLVQCGKDVYLQNSIYCSGVVIIAMRTPAGKSTLEMSVEISKIYLYTHFLV